MNKSTLLNPVFKLNMINIHAHERCDIRTYTCERTFISAV
jgi:hypothetical protein